MSKVKFRVEEAVIDGFSAELAVELPASVAAGARYALAEATEVVGVKSTSGQFLAGDYQVAVSYSHASGWDIEVTGPDGDEVNAREFAARLGFGSKFDLAEELTGNLFAGARFYEGELTVEVK